MKPSTDTMWLTDAETKSFLGHLSYLMSHSSNEPRYTDDYSRDEMSDGALWFDFIGERIQFSGELHFTSLWHDDEADPDDSYCGGWTLEGLDDVWADIDTIADADGNDIEQGTAPYEAIAGRIGSLIEAHFNTPARQPQRMRLRAAV